MTADTAERGSSGAGSAPPTAPGAAASQIVFEQPLNERLRTFLRIDFLYSQALFHSQSQSQWGSRAAVASLLDIIAITSRSDARADALKELERQLASLNEFQSRPGVDTSRLRTVISNLLRLRAALLASGAQYLQPLRDSDFLSAIKHRSAIPGGTCEFDLPDFYFWLSQPGGARTETFASWLALVRPLCDSVSELLWLVRQSGRPRRETARGGVYHITFDRENPVQLLRIAVPGALGIYPEISGSQHSWAGPTERARQVESDVEFELTCCT
jgi:cell division protein ZapD